MVLGVLALHAVLLLVATQLRVWPDRVSARGPAPVAAPPLVLWLLDRATPRLPRPAATHAPQPAQPPREPRASWPPSPPAAAGEPQAITPPTPTPTPTPVADAPLEAPRQAEPASPLSTAPAVLNLTLPRAASAAWRQPNPALDEPRGNRPPRTLETLIAQALGGDPNGPISEEHLADGSVRFRRGQQCVVSRPNQAQNIDPYNASVMPKPRLLDKC